MTASEAISGAGDVERNWRMNMQTTVMKLAIALAVAGGVALSAAAVSLGGATASFAQSQSQSQCIPHYDSSGAQTAPYC
jgi:hypothetical protein